ncbi:MAG: hypothetical protein IPO05_00020 [Flavobacteriales bacterium]|nr:hypothetical protein [Flavobacteriales bacterium]
MKNLLLIPILGLLVAPALAQVTNPGGEYIIQGVYSPTLMDAQKIDLRPEPIDTILPTLPVRYDVLPVKAEIPAKVDSIAAAKLSVLAPQPQLYKGFVKAGFGLYTTPLGELYFDQTRSRKNGYGIHAKHFSSNGGLDDVGPSVYSFNSVDGYYKHFLPDHEATGRLMYDRRRVSYYGYAANDSINDALDALDAPEDARKQFYNDIWFAGRLRSLYTDSTKFTHDVGLEVHSYSNLSESRETNMRVNATGQMTVGAETYGGSLLIDNNAYKGVVKDLAEFRQNGTLVGLQPHVSTKGDAYLVRVGVGLFVDALGSTTFHFYPQAYAHYSLFNNILIPYAGLHGERRRNSFRSLTQANPWLIGAPALANTSLMYDLYGGLRGSFSSDLGFDVRVSKSRQDAMPLYVNVSNAPFGDRMDVVYDRVDVLDLSGEVNYRRKEAISFSARVDVFTYKTKVQLEAWNLPPYQLTFGGRYDMRGKLIVKAEAQFLGKRPAFRLGDTITQGGLTVLVPSSSVDLDGYLDLYLGLEYRYTKRLSIFVDMSNLSASKYERWYRYPVQRGLLLGGVTYAF